jgi:hypothetical protein
MPKIGKEKKAKKRQLFGFWGDSLAGRFLAAVYN